MTFRQMALFIISGMLAGLGVVLLAIAAIVTAIIVIGLATWEFSWGALLLDAGLLLLGCIFFQIGYQLGPYGNRRSKPPKSESVRDSETTKR